MGRSPRLATANSTVARPVVQDDRAVADEDVAWRILVRNGRPAGGAGVGRARQETPVERERHVPVLGHDRMVHRDELRPVRERALHLDLVDHVGNAVQHVGVARAAGAPGP